MSMLESMRSGSDSAGMQIILGMVVVAFMFWGVNPQGDTTSVVVDVNGVKIMNTEFQRAVRNAEQYQEGNLNRALSDAEKEQLRERVREQMIEAEVIRQRAEDLGLVVSDTEVAKEVAQIPAFQDDKGILDLELYTRNLKRMGYTRSAFEERLRDDLLREKLRQMVFMGATISEPVVRDSYVKSNTQLDLRTLRLRPTMFYSKLEVSDEDAAQWLTENGEKSKEIYDRDYDRRYNHPEEVRVSMIRLGIKKDGQGAAELIPRMRKLKEEIEAGADFGELARKWSEDRSAEKDGDVGMRPLSRFDSVELEAIRDLAVGELSKVLTDESEIKLFRMEERKEAWVETLEDVQLAIAKQSLKESLAPEKAAELAEQVILPAWKESGTEPTDLLEEHGLAVTSTGLIPTGGGEGPFQPPSEMMKAASSADIGDVLPEVYEENGVLWLGSLIQRVDADMDQYETEKEQIREAALSERRVEFFQAWVEDSVASAVIK